VSRYPEIRAGQRITGQMLTGMQFEEVVKQAATIRSSDPNLTADPDLRFELEGNATYHVEFWIQYSTDSTADFKTDWQVPTGATGLKRRAGGKVGTDATNDGEWTDMAWAVHGFGTTVRYGDRLLSSQVFAVETGIIITADAGTLALRWAQNASSGGDTEVSAFSYARLKRVA